ncbi:T9SS type A sorting domain-containing protein [Algibacter miyuki]|uniref:T9SS type A sorting domain-containing protein n=1 Tax=Algibacter miyuki TaxID=1306933 RepID=A0ABV5GWV0_9FLAO|nr:T9SS type A sorting domain-containing protein [Algibacter miyuki]MDN3664561.1 T9SS type A sorting domain-containing protein [Algibacter miyuki]
MKKQLLSIVAVAGALILNAQVTLVKEINDAGSSNSSPANLTVHNGQIFFSADDSNGSNTPGGAHLGKELWVTDGTSTGTTFVKDIRTGNSSSNPGNLFTFNNKLYFTAFDTSSELWTSDGTEAGTTKVDLMSTITGESPQRFVELDGLAYFTVGGQPGSTTGETVNKLVQWDGVNDAVQVADVGAGYEVILQNMIVFNNQIFMYMNYSTEDATVGNELYAYNPTADTFSLIKDIDTGTGDSSISNFTILGSTLYFEADNSLWKTDGTTAGTLAVASASTLAGIANLYAWNDLLFFEGDDGTNGDQLYVFNPTLDTVTNISNISGSDNNHDPEDFTAYNGYVYYSGENGTSSDKFLFRTDGVTVSQLDATIKEIDEVTVLNGMLYFEGNNGSTGKELYSFDPSTLSVDNTQAEIISVYPNPTSDYIMVPTTLVNTNYTIHDLSGKQVSQGVISSEKIELNLNSGMYLLNIKTDLSSITKKIMVK